MTSFVDAISFAIFWAILALAIWGYLAKKLYDCNPRAGKGLIQLIVWILGRLF
jgi:hypothetical protein